MSKSIKAKMRCLQVNQFENSESVTLAPVSLDSEENKTFSKYTPSGKLELAVTNENAFGYFKPGKEYYIDITAAEAG